MLQQKYSKVIELVPAIVPAAYGSGDVVGTITTLGGVAQNKSGIVKLQSLNLIDNANVKKALALYFFSATVDPGNDNAALDLTAAESLLWLATVEIAAADYVSTAGGTPVAHLNKNNIGQLLKVSAQNELFVVLATREAVTYAAATNLKFRLGFEGP